MSFVPLTCELLARYSWVSCCLQQLTHEAAHLDLSLCHRERLSAITILVVGDCVSETLSVLSAAAAAGDDANATPT